MAKAVPDWETNWQGQIDYALTEDVGPQYRSATAGMNDETITADPNTKDTVVAWTS